MKTAVVIGRFQVPRLHQGHLYLLQKAQEAAESEDGKLIVLLGIAPHVNERNVLPFEVRREMIWEAMGNLPVLALYDVPDNDKVWSKQIDALLSNYPDPAIFGSRDSCLTHYMGKFPVIEITEYPGGMSGTNLRKEMTFNHNEDFRKGIFYAYTYLNKHL